MHVISRFLCFLVCLCLPSVNLSHNPEPPPPETLAVWLGASDLDHEGDWQWFDGSPIKAEDWHWNAPNNGFGLEHCMVLRPDFDPPLNDAECDRPKKFVCEYDLLKG